MVPKAKTPLGRRLKRIRAKIEDSGVPLLTWEQIAAAAPERRGERHETEPH